MDGRQDILAHTKGDKSAVGRIMHVAVKPADIKTARKNVKLSRDAFARVFDLSASPSGGYASLSASSASSQGIRDRIGRRERIHLTLKKEATHPPGMNDLQQQAKKINSMHVSL